MLNENKSRDNAGLKSQTQLVKLNFLLRFHRGGGGGGGLNTVGGGGGKQRRSSEGDRKLQDEAPPLLFAKKKLHPCFFFPYCFLLTQCKNRNVVLDLHTWSLKS